MKRENMFFFSFSSDNLYDFGDYFIKIIDKLYTNLTNIINLYEHEVMAEDKLIAKIC